MKNNHTRWFIISIFFVVVYSILLLGTSVFSVGRYSSTNYVCFITSFFITILVPGICSVLGYSPRFLEIVTADCILLFIFEFVAGVALSAFFGDNLFITLATHGFLVLGFSFLLLRSIVTQPKTTAGKATKQEESCIRQCIQEVQFMLTLNLPEQESLIRIHALLHKGLAPDHKVLHGVEKTFLGECRAIQSAVFSGSNDSVALHVAMFECLLMLWLQQDRTEEL